MIKDPEYYARFKAGILAGDRLDLPQKYAILDALYHEARALGKFNETDSLLGLEDTIRLASALNAHLPGTSRPAVTGA